MRPGTMLFLAAVAWMLLTVWLSFTGGWFGAIFTGIVALIFFIIAPLV